MIEMTCGAYGAKGRLIRPADGPFSLSADEEKRLVQRGVARYVREEAVEPLEPDEGGQEEKSAPPPEEPKKPGKPKKPGNAKDEAPPELSPEDPVE